MTPLFASTLATQTDMDDDESMSVNIRATQQDAQFSATQNGESTCSIVVVNSFGIKFCGFTENDVFIGCWNNDYFPMFNVGPGWLNELGSWII